MNARNTLPAQASQTANIDSIKLHRTAHGKWNSIRNIQLAQSAPINGPKLSQLIQPSQAGQPTNLNNNEQNTQPAQYSQPANLTKVKLNCELCTKDVDTLLANHMILNHPG